MSLTIKLQCSKTAVVSSSRHAAYVCGLRPARTASPAISSR